jgi:hypothetical protein
MEAGSLPVVFRVVKSSPQIEMQGSLLAVTDATTRRAAS